MPDLDYGYEVTIQTPATSNPEASSVTNQWQRQISGNTHWEEIGSGETYKISSGDRSAKIRLQQDLDGAKVYSNELQVTSKTPPPPKPFGVVLTSGNLRIWTRNSGIDPILVYKEENDGSWVQFSSFGLDGTNQGEKFETSEPGHYAWDATNMTGLRIRAWQVEFSTDPGSFTGNVTNMDYVLRGCNLFNSDISDWDTSKVTNLSFGFSECSSFNQDLSNWDTSNVTDMFYMCKEAINFNCDISGWDTSNVTRMAYAFLNTGSFNRDIGGWDVSNVTNMGYMFENAQAFNQDIGNWDVGNVTNMKFMFSRAKAFNQDIGGWDVSKVEIVEYMFLNAVAFNQDLGNWDVTGVTNRDRMLWMFSNAVKFNQDLSSWCVVNITSKPSHWDDNTPRAWTTARKPQWGQPC